MLTYNSPSEAILRKYGFCEMGIPGIFICHFRPGVSSMLMFVHGLVSLVDEQEFDENVLEAIGEDIEEGTALLDEQHFRFNKIMTENDDQLDFLLKLAFN